MSFIPQLTEFLQQGKDLPTLPEIVLELHAALDDELSSDGQITGIIEADPALASRLLRVANSAFFNRGDRIGTVLAAIQRLGVNRVRSICIVLDIVKWSSARNGALNHREFWAHSAAVGTEQNGRERARSLRLIHPDSQSVLVLQFVDADLTFVLWVVSHHLFAYQFSTNQ